MGNFAGAESMVHLGVGCGPGIQRACITVAQKRDKMHALPVLDY